MTAIKATSRDKIILYFSNRISSKNHIKQSLRKCEIINMEPKINENENEFIIYNNIIKVGIYTITLYFPFDSSPHWRKLKDYGDFHIRIHDTIDQKSDIDIKIDSRFKSQYWVSKNFFGQLRIKHLIEIIAYCSRLNNLKAFY